MTKSTTDNLKTLSTGQCPTLSEKAQLRYAVKADLQDNYFVVLLSNSNPGQFNVNEAVSLSDISALLSKVSPTSNVTSVHIAPLFRGSSSNNAGFMLAVLKHLGLVIQEDPTKPRSHKLANDFQDRIAALGKPGATKKPTRKKVARKKTSRSRKLLNDT